jgi:hypothetical protein
MATNLRLRPDAEAALRREAERTGRSQQEVIREAIDHHLGLASGNPSDELGALLASGAARPPRARYRRPVHRLELSTGLSSDDLLDRVDRI